MENILMSLTELSKFISYGELFGLLYTDEMVVPQTTIEDISAEKSEYISQY